MSQPKIDQWMSDAAWEIYSATKKGEIKPDWIQKVIASHAPSAPSEQCPGLLPSEAERAQEQQILFHHERASEAAAQPTHRYQHNGTFQGGCMCGKSFNDACHAEIEHDHRRRKRCSGQCPIAQILRP